MTRDEFLAFHKECVQAMHEITKAKNADYTGDGNAFDNFKLTEAYGVTSASQGFFVRMSDKMARIASYIKKGQLQVKDESVEDTLLDLANYSLLFLGYIKSEKAASSSTPSQGTGRRSEEEDPVRLIPPSHG